MPRKKKAEPKYPDNWVVLTTWVANSRYLTPGTELSIEGERGRFRFVKLVQVLGHVPEQERDTVVAQWVDVVGGKNNLDRSFHPSRIKTVHRLKKTRENAA